MEHMGKSRWKRMYNSWDTLSGAAKFYLMIRHLETRDLPYMGIRKNTSPAMSWSFLNAVSTYVALNLSLLQQGLQTHFVFSSSILHLYPILILEGEDLIRW